MKRIRDYILARVLEDLTNKKVEYILDEDITNLDTFVIRNVEGGAITAFKDPADFEFFGLLKEGVNIEFDGFDLTDYVFTFNNPINKIIFRNCRVDGLKIVLKNKTKGYYLELDNVRNETGIDLYKQMPECSELVVIGKATTELTRKYSVEEITNTMKEKYENYMQLLPDKQARLLKLEGYLSIYPQRIEITGIDKLKLLKRVSLNYMEIDEINFSEITKYSSDIRCLDEIYFKNCTFNEAPILYKQPVKRLVVNDCNVIRKELLPNFVGIEAIEIIDTKGAELPKLNEPKLLKGLKFVASEVNMDKIAKVKNLTTLIVLEQELPDLTFAKKLKSLKCLVVSKDMVKDKSLLKKMKKVEFIEVEEDDITAKYNELFV